MRISTAVSRPAIVFATLAVAAIGLTVYRGTRAEAKVTETMTDRCSKEVVISPVYNNAFPPVGGIALKRGPDGWTPWSQRMPVNGHTWIRWWCHSTTGNMFDPGTYRITNIYIGASVQLNPDTGMIAVDPSVKPQVMSVSGSSGWTPERSRCDSSSTRSISARLGPDRLLQMRCHTEAA